MLRPPPRSTLFSYTTLFRSVNSPCRSRMRPVVDVIATEAPRRPSSRAAAKPIPDRKSTRLNSSHITISYAVLCLKKKPEHAYHTPRQREFPSDHTAHRVRLL